MFRRIFPPYYSLEEPHWLSIFHRIFCFLCAIPFVYYLLMCCCSFSDAFDDWRTYKGLGFPYSLGYYLGKEHVLECSGIPFFCTAVEWAVYVVLYYRAEKMNPIRGSAWYFGAMFVIHAAMWLHGNALPLANDLPFSTTEFPLVYYRSFAKMTILPSVVYFVMYLLRIWKNKSRVDA